MDEEEILPLVVENGSGTSKLGFASEDIPRHVFQTCIGRKTCSSKEEFFIGADTQNRKDLSLTYPIEHGVVSNWDDMQKVWDYSFNKKLNIDPEKQPILLSEPPLNPFVNREQIGQMMFELYNFPSLAFVSKGILAQYAGGRTASFVLGLGDGVIHVTPIYEGFTLPHVSTRVDFGGRDLTEYMMSLLSMKNYSFSTTSDREIVRNIKETCCYVAADYNLELQKCVEKRYSLSQGDNIVLAEERFKCPEALFQPSLLGIKSKGIHEILYDCIMQCDVDIRRDIGCGIILSGGTSHIPGLAERLKRELAELTSLKIRIICNSESRYYSWIGGSIIASLSSFKGMWIKRSRYEEIGPSIFRDLYC